MTRGTGPMVSPTRRATVRLAEQRHGQHTPELADNAIQGRVSAVIHDHDLERGRGVVHSGKSPETAPELNGAIVRGDNDGERGQRHWGASASAARRSASGTWRNRWNSYCATRVTASPAPPR